MSATLTAQVTIKEKVKITPGQNRPAPASVSMTFVFYWCALTQGDNYPMIHLGVRGPCYGHWGFDLDSGTAIGNYSETITYKYTGIYYGETVCTITDPKPGYYNLCAIADTSADIHHVYSFYSCNTLDVYVSGQYDTLLKFGRFGWSDINGTPYQINCNTDFTEMVYLLKGDPLNPGGVHFHFGTVGDVQHGVMAYPYADILDACGQTVSNPPEQYFRFELSGDSLTWGVLRNPITGATGAVLDSVNSTQIEFDAWGKDPELPQPVTVKISAVNGSIPPDSVTLMVMPSQVRVIGGRSILPYTDTTHLSRGDTTMFTMQVRGPGGMWIDKPSDWTAHYQIVQSDTFGFLYNLDSNQVGVSIDSVPVVVYSANLNMTPDSVEVLIQLVSEEPCTSCVPASTLPVSPGSNASRQSERAGKVNLAKAKSNALQRGVTPTTIGTGGIAHYGLARVMLKKYEILLGGTKYYYLKLYENNGQYVIEESPIPNATGVQGVEFSVERLPVYAARPNEKPDGSRCGVYYEYRDSTGTKFIDTTKQIRLIGRYWHQDSTYVVKLSAKKGGQVKGNAIIEVKKPDKLGDDYGPLPNGGRKSKAYNVFNQEYNLDSVIVLYAGKFGIPPQIIKGQIEKEAVQFNPSYLYEPFKDINLQSLTEDSIKIYNNQYRILSSSDEGTPPIPTNHSNLWNVFGITEYPGYGGTIWKYYNRYKNTLYARVNSKGTVVYETLNDIWKDSLFNPISKNLIKAGTSENDAKDQATVIANDSLPKYLRYKYKNGLMDTLPAQTRIVASYGLLQLVYCDAVTDDGYMVNNVHLPENLSLTDTNLVYASNHLISKFKLKNIKQRFSQSSQWKLGFEKTFRRALNRYRGEDAIQGTYGDAILKGMKSYTPKNSNQ